MVTNTLLRGATVVLNVEKLSSIPSVARLYGLLSENWYFRKSYISQCGLTCS